MDVRIVEALYESIRMKRTVPLALPQLKKGPALQQEIHRPAHGKPETIRTSPPSRDAA